MRPRIPGLRRDMVVKPGEASSGGLIGPVPLTPPLPRQYAFLGFLADEEESLNAECTKILDTTFRL